MAVGFEIVGELLDARLVRHGREGIGRAGRRLGRVLASRAVHLVELLGLRVVRLHLVVADRPRGRDAVVVAQLAEVLLPEAVQRRAVELGGAADEVVHLRLERLRGLTVVPGVLRDVAVVDEHVPGGPVLRLAREPVPALQQQDALARGSEAVHKRAAAGAAADDDDVVVAHPLISSSRSASTIARRRLDQGEVRERLREVAEVPAGAGVELLGVEAERRGDAEQALHQVAGALRSPRRSRAPTRARTSRSGSSPPCPTGRRPSRRCGSGARSRPRSGRRRSPRRSCADARRRPAGSRRARRAGWRRPARPCRSAGAGRRRAGRARGCPP